MPFSPRQQELLAGLRDCAPLLMGIAPYGMICGAASVQSGLTPELAVAMSFIVFAGSSQIAATQLMSAGASLLVVVATAAIVNLRFMIYSASIGHHFQNLPPRWKWLMSYFLTDQSYAMTVARRFEEGEFRPQWYFLGASLGCWLLWQCGLVAGAYLGTLIPASWSFDFVIPLTFIALVAPLLKDRAMIAAAAVGGTVAAIGGLPYKLDIIAAAGAGIAAGMALEAACRK